MRIAILSPMVHPISEPFAGGTEAVIAQLAQGLAKRGHVVTLYATAASHVPGVDVQTLGVQPVQLRWPVAPSDMDGGTMRQLLADEQRVFHRLCIELRKTAGAYDVIHNNSFSGTPLLLSEGLGVPMITTLHVPPILVEQVTALRTLAEAGIPSSLVAVSAGLAREFAPICPVDRVIYNGVVVPPRAGNEPRSGLLFVGRLTAEKGADLAIAVARTASQSLTIVGRVEDDAFFQREIAPHVDGRQVNYAGHLSQPEVWAKMSTASAVLFTPRWPEPCSLTVLEALSRGTPAIAFAVGGLPEQIVDGITGFLVPPGDIRAMAHIIDDVNRLSPEDCRTDMLARFSVEAMLDGYESFFRVIQATRK